MEFDAGPPQALANLFAQVPDPLAKERFWFDWGPVFYRGRLDGTARVLCVASDPGATERIAGRTLVGDAGQRVQGFLAKIGLTRSYVCLNAFPFGLFPSEAHHASEMLREQAQATWRNELYDTVRTADLQAIVAFGNVAQEAVSLWDGRKTTPVFEVPHPSSHNEQVLLRRWARAVDELRRIVSPDPDGDPTVPNYGDVFRESDYAPIPRRDLPFGVPSFLGDDSPGRALDPPRRSSVRRPQPDDRHTLIWAAPVQPARPARKE